MKRTAVRARRPTSDPARQKSAQRSANQFLSVWVAVLRSNNVMKSLLIALLTATARRCCGIGSGKHGRGQLRQILPAWSLAA
jgi:hypothetical protein